MTGETGVRPLTQWTMAIAAGVTVANLYYNQPLLTEIGRSFAMSDRMLGLIPTLTQIGYALGMVFLVPLGDSLERRSTAVRLTLISGAVLLAVAFAPSAGAVLLLSLLLGLTTVAPQLLVPLAADLAVPSARGRVVGTIMSGLLFGILLSRTVAGVVGAHLGWRVMFGIAAGAAVLVAIALHFALPVREPVAPMPYRRLLRSIVTLAVEEPALRLHALLGAATFGAFSAFWATLAPLLHAMPEQYGPQTVGMFGVIGLVGVVAAPLVGRIADKRADRRANAIGLWVTLVAFGVFAAFGRSLWGLAAGVVLLDVGAQANHISNQARIFALRPEARSRVNTVYMFSYFAGGALGAFLGMWGWTIAGAAGIWIVGAGMVVAGLIVLGLATARERARADALQA